MDGVPLEFLQFETWEIALDQGEDIAGIDKEEWQHCHIPITDPEGRMTWQG